MKPIIDLVTRGGPVMFAIITLSVILYSRCIKLLISLHQLRRKVCAAQHQEAPDTLTSRRIQEEARELFRQQRVALGAMIAAAPLLGLLGTVSGMVKTFENLSGHGTDKSMAGLASGISEVLVATESGLAVAIPALLLVYIAHRGAYRNAPSITNLRRNLQRPIIS